MLSLKFSIVNSNHTLQQECNSEHAYAVDLKQIKIYICNDISDKEIQDIYRSIIKNTELSIGKV